MFTHLVSKDVGILPGDLVFLGFGHATGIEKPPCSTQKAVGICTNCHPRPTWGFQGGTGSFGRHCFLQRGCGTNTEWEAKLAVQHCPTLSNIVQQLNFYHFHNFEWLAVTTVATWLFKPRESWTERRAFLLGTGLSMSVGVGHKEYRHPKLFSNPRRNPSKDCAQHLSFVYTLYNLSWIATWDKSLVFRISPTGKALCFAIYKYIRVHQFISGMKSHKTRKWH